MLFFNKKYIQEDFLKELNIAKVSEKSLNSFQGALLTVKSKDKLNTMTIGWATLGRVWNKPIMTVLVRFSEIYMILSVTLILLR